MILPLVSAGQENAGFVHGIWFEREPVFADEPVRVFVAVRNHTGRELTGTVRFVVDEETIGEQPVTAPSGRLIEAWAHWIPAYGTSTVRASLYETSLGNEATSSALSMAAATATRFVDRDTDGDGVGNAVDTDDDGDEIPDEADDEPLVYNEPVTEEEDEGDETETDETTASADEETLGGQATRTGLEQYVDHEPTSEVLGVMTDTINRTKERLDGYRAARADARAARTDDRETATTSTSTATTTADREDETTVEERTGGFGTITRSQSESGPGLLSQGWQLTRDLLDRGYTVLLTGLSLLLGHPAIVQFVLLVLIIFIVFKLARRLSRRPI